MWFVVGDFINTVETDKYSVLCYRTGPSRGTDSLTRSLSPYRMSVSARGAQINLGYSGGSSWADVESRRASSNVSQVGGSTSCYFHRNVIDATKM
jgi:hypothetical protein